MIIDPDEAARRYYQQKQAEAEEAKNTLLRAYKNKKTVTKSGKEIKLYANISTPSDISDVLANGAEGIGNFKTEFMYLNSPDYPEEEALFQAYKKIAGQMSGQKVVIRTFDIGTDKTADYFGIGTNDLIQYTLAADRQNPKLGSIYNPYHPAVLRSIRYVIENAHRAGIWTSVSGELGADSAMTETFIKWGIDALAAPPSKILPLRKKICEMNETV